MHPIRNPSCPNPYRLCCDGCDFVFYLDPKLAAGVVATVEGRVLLVRRAIEPAYGTWVFPGGYVDRGEHPAGAARREALEEAGVVVALEGLLGIYQYREPASGKSYVRFAFSGEITGHEPDRALDTGILRAVWVTRDEARNLSDRHRSPLVMTCIEDHAAGKRHSLELLAFYSA